MFSGPRSFPGGGGGWGVYPSKVCSQGGSTQVRPVATGYPYCTGPLICSEGMKYTVTS